MRLISISLLSIVAAVAMMPVDVMANGFDIFGDEPSYDIFTVDTDSQFTIGKPEVVTMATVQDDCPGGVCEPLEQSMPMMAANSSFAYSTPVSYSYSIPYSVPISPMETQSVYSVAYSEPVAYSYVTYSEPVVYRQTFASRVFARRQGFRSRRLARKRARWCS